MSFRGNSTFGPRSSVIMSSRVGTFQPSSAGVPAAGSQFKGAASALDKKQWSTRADSGRKWYRAKPGLCVEGLCDTPTCIAYGKMVIFNAGFTSLNLISCTSCKCPCCQHTITPATAAFNRCEWKINGKKRATPGAALEEVDMEDWEVAGNCYERFKDDPNDTTVWTKLVITTRPPTIKEEKPAKKRARSGSDAEDPNLVECSICCSDPVSRFGATAINTPCGHCFHKECLKPWVLGGKTDCPTCHRDISCLADELQK